LIGSFAVRFIPALRPPRKFAEAAPTHQCIEEALMAKKRKRKYSKGASKEVEREMRRYKRGTAKSGKGGRGGKVKSRKQAIAIGLSNARKKGKKVPKRRKGKKKKS
jgi:hypothetical protein